MCGGAGRKGGALLFAPRPPASVSHFICWCAGCAVQCNAAQGLVVLLPIPIKRDGEDKDLRQLAERMIYHRVLDAVMDQLRELAATGFAVPRADGSDLADRYYVRMGVIRADLQVCTACDQCGSCAHVLSCAVLCCPVLSCAVLYAGAHVLSCAVLCCPVLSCAVLCCPVLSCAVLRCPVCRSCTLCWG